MFINYHKCLRCSVPSRIDSGTANTAQESSLLHYNTGHDPVASLACVILANWRRSCIARRRDIMPL